LLMRKSSSWWSVVAVSLIVLLSIDIWLRLSTPNAPAPPPLMPSDSQTIRPPLHQLVANRLQTLTRPCVATSTAPGSRGSAMATTGSTSTAAPSSLSVPPIRPSLHPQPSVPRGKPGLRPTVLKPVAEVYAEMSTELHQQPKQQPSSAMSMADLLWLFLTSYRPFASGAQEVMFKTAYIESGWDVSFRWD